nr:multifunctional CCA tRNA nucleotidyl transferase/2'3'-cyclic phosphodiesterase/2'nucleotidase/phosphatase [Burkholderiaceae bacterium]
ESSAIDKCLDFDANALVDLLERCDAFRKPTRLKDILLASACLAQVGNPSPDKPYLPQQRLLSAFSAAQTVATDLIANSAILAGATGPKIGQLIHAARVEAVHRLF